MTAMVIIPARYDSTRFPGKPLYPLKGKPLIQHVYEKAKLSHLSEDVIVATDDKTIFEKVFSFGGRAVMTDKRHPSGTDRIAEVAESVSYDIIVNVQADEPLIRPEMIDDVIAILDDERASIGTLVKKTEDFDEIANPNVVKVVFDKENFAIYFSRSPIPYHRDEWSIGSAGDRAKDIPEVRNRKSGIGKIFCYKHIGIYSYRRDALLSFSKMKPAELEKKEKLEQLRAIENGMKIKIKETFFEIHGVDTPADLERVEKCLSISL